MLECRVETGGGRAGVTEIAGASGPLERGGRGRQRAGADTEGDALEAVRAVLDGAGVASRERRQERRDLPRGIRRENPRHLA